MKYGVISRVSLFYLRYLRERCKKYRGKMIKMLKIFVWVGG